MAVKIGAWMRMLPLLLVGAVAWATPARQASLAYNLGMPDDVDFFAFPAELAHVQPGIWLDYGPSLDGGAAWGAGSARHALWINRANLIIDPVSGDVSTAADTLGEDPGRLVDYTGAVDGNGAVDVGINVHGGLAVHSESDSAATEDPSSLEDTGYDGPTTTTSTTGSFPSMAALFGGLFGLRVERDAAVTNLSVGMEVLSVDAGLDSSIGGSDAGTVVTGKAGLRHLRDRWVVGGVVLLGVGTDLSATTLAVQGGPRFAGEWVDASLLFGGALGSVTAGSSATVIAAVPTSGLAAELHVADHFDLRGNASFALMTVAATDYLDVAPVPGGGLGAGWHADRWAVDLQVAPDFVDTGPYLLTGSQSGFVFAASARALLGALPDSG